MLFLIGFHGYRLLFHVRVLHSKCKCTDDTELQSFVIDYLGTHRRILVRI